MWCVALGRSGEPELASAGVLVVILPLKTFRPGSRAKILPSVVRVGGGPGTPAIRSAVCLVSDGSVLGSAERVGCSDAPSFGVSRSRILGGGHLVEWPHFL